MGGCVSSESNADLEQKKRSQMIDRKLEEDSRRLRRECKILLLGRFIAMSCRRSDGRLILISCFPSDLQAPVKVENRPSSNK